MTIDYGKDTDLERELTARLSELAHAFIADLNARGRLVETGGADTLRRLRQQHRTPPPAGGTEPGDAGYEATGTEPHPVPGAAARWEAVTAPPAGEDATPNPPATLRPLRILGACEPHPAGADPLGSGDAPPRTAAPAPGPQPAALEPVPAQQAATRVPVPAPSAGARQPHTADDAREPYTADDAREPRLAASGQGQPPARVQQPTTAQQSAPDRQLTTAQQSAPAQQLTTARQSVVAQESAVVRELAVAEPAAAPALAAARQPAALEPVPAQQAAGRVPAPAPSAGAQHGHTADGGHAQPPAPAQQTAVPAAAQQTAVPAAAPARQRDALEPAPARSTGVQGPRTADGGGQAPSSAAVTAARLRAENAARLEVTQIASDDERVDVHIHAVSLGDWEYWLTAIGAPLDAPTRRSGWVQTATGRLDGVEVRLTAEAVPRLLQEAAQQATDPFLLGGRVYDLARAHTDRHGQTWHHHGRRQEDDIPLVTLGGADDPCYPLTSIAVANGPLTPAAAPSDHHETG
ncbi:BN159_2729 family protein [Streptomyces sp. NPDC002250]|uniref:BN159_2729 family protein n=1 Tax=Streptomyces sp. NPDC002250 TaxID=3364641 RepID=UPI0036930860